MPERGVETRAAFDFGRAHSASRSGRTGARHRASAGHHRRSPRRRALRRDREAGRRSGSPARLVVGLPLGPDGARAPADAAARSASRASWRAASRLPVTLVDERLYVGRGRRALARDGRGGRKRQATSHPVAAQLILQDLLDRHALPDAETLCAELVRAAAAARHAGDRRWSASTPAAPGSPSACTASSASTLPLGPARHLVLPRRLPASRACTSGAKRQQDPVRRRRAPTSCWSTTCSTPGARCARR